MGRTPKSKRKRKPKRGSTPKVTKAPVSQPLRGEQWFLAELEKTKVNVVFPPKWAPAERTISGVTLSTVIREAANQYALVIENAVINGGVSAGYITVERPLVFTNCIFKGDVLFAGSRLHNLFFGGCRIEGDLLMQSVELQALNLARSGQVKTTVTGNVTLNSAVVHKTVRLNHAEFHGDVDWIRAHIRGDFQARFALFCGENIVWGSAATVDGSVDFRAARAYGTFDCGGISIGAELNLSGSVFYKKTQQAVFERCTVKRGVIADHAIFSGGVNFAGSQLLNGFDSRYSIYGSDAFFNWSEFTTLINFTGAQFRGPANFSHCRFTGTTSFASAQFSTVWDLSSTVFDGAVHAFEVPPDFAELEEGEKREEVRKTILPTTCIRRGMRIDGCDISDITTDERWRDWVAIRGRENALELGPYLSLERELRNSGDVRLADEVRFEMGVARTQRFRDEREWLRWAFYQFLNWTVGFGGKGHRLAVWALFFFSLAWAYFSIRFCIAGKEFAEISSALYAVDLLLPVSLGQETSVASDSVITRLVTVGLKLAGWALIPTALAYFSGLFGPPRSGR